jgi:hypothetical protein
MENFVVWIENCERGVVMEDNKEEEDDNNLLD